MARATGACPACGRGALISGADAQAKRHQPILAQGRAQQVWYEDGKVRSCPTAPPGTASHAVESARDDEEEQADEQRIDERGGSQGCLAGVEVAEKQMGRHKPRRALASPP